MTDLPPSASHSSLALLRWAADRFHSARAFHLAFRLLASLTFLVAVSVAYLWIVGVPARVTNAILQQLESGGAKISIDRMWLDPIEGLKARNLRVVPRNQTAAGPLTAKEMLVGINWLNIPAGQPWLEALTLRGGSAVIKLPPEFGTNGLPCDFAFSNVNARLENTWGMFRLEKFSAQWAGGTISGHGVMVSETSGAAAAPAGGAMIANSMKMQTKLSESPPWARELYQHLRAIETREPIGIEFEFRQHDAAPELGDVRLHVKGGAAVCRGIHVDGWEIEADIARGMVRAPLIELRAEGRSCHLDATCDLTSREVELHAVNELPPAYWRDLLPPQWLVGLSRTPLQFRGKLHSEIWLPRASFADFGNRWHGTMSWDDAQFREIAFSRGRLDIVRNGPQFIVTNVSAIASRNGMSGPVAGDINIDLPTGDVDGRLNATLDPHLFSPWIPRHTREFISEFNFPGDAPTFAGQFRAGGTSNDLLMISGLVSATNFIYRDVSIVTLQSGFDYSNDFLKLAPFAFARTNGDVSGRLDLDLEHEVYAFDLHCTTDPLSVGRIVSSNLLQSLAVGHYDGPAKFHARGSYDDRNPANIDLLVDVDADRIGLKWFTAEHAVFTLHNRGLQYEATNIVAQAFGGDLNGRFFLYPDRTESTNSRFELDLVTRSNELKEVTLALHPESKDPPSGIMKLNLQIAGLIEDDDMSSYKGEGKISIRDGQLHKIALFGGLSSLLAHLSPDLGFANQRGLTMTFDIRNGKLTTSDAVLEGELMSVKGKGTYALADNRLDFLAEVQLLKKGTVVGDAIRFITTPVTKLFQIQLLGTLDKPEWKTANLPKIF